MSWAISIQGTRDELVDKIDSPEFPLSDENAPDYAKNRFAEVREAVRQIAIGCGDGAEMTITGGGHTNGGDVNEGNIQWSSRAKPAAA